MMKMRTMISFLRKNDETIFTKILKIKKKKYLGFYLKKIIILILSFFFIYFFQLYDDLPLL